MVSMEKQRVVCFDDILRKKLKGSRFKQLFEEEGVKLDIAVKVRKLREKVSLTQSQLAKRMRTSQQAISRMERGLIGKCNLRTLMKFASATGTFLRLEFVDGKHKKAA